MLLIVCERFAERRESLLFDYEWFAERKELLLIDDETATERKALLLIDEETPTECEVLLLTIVRASRTAKRVLLRLHGCHAAVAFAVLTTFFRVATIG